MARPPSTAPRRAEQHPTHNLLCDWNDARRADKYRLRGKVKATGVQVFNELVSDRQGIIHLSAQPANSELEITGTGRNAVGESSPHCRGHGGVAVGAGQRGTQP